MRRAQLTCPSRKADMAIRRKAYVQFDRTVESLNATMGICLN